MNSTASVTPSSGGRTPSIPSRYRTLIRWLLISVLLGYLLAVGYPYVMRRSNGAAFVDDTTITVVLIRIILFSGIAALPVSWCVFGFATVNAWLHRYRWIIGMAIIFSAVTLNISGSSLGYWSQLLGTTPNGLVLGQPRGIRSDEFMVNTPFAFSQEYNNYGYFNPLIGNRPSDMNLIKDSPIWAVTELFRPFHWGYFFLGSSRGLSLYWFGRLVVLFLSVYELLLLVTSGKRRIAIVGTVLITFSPAIQWWFAVNNLPEMMIAAALSVVLLHRYLNTRNPIVRAGYLLVIAQMAGMFILGFYPAWEIPLCIVLCMLLASVIVGNRRLLAFSKWDILNALWILAVFLILMYIIVHRSMPTIQATLHTVYPGHRISSGGGLPVQELFTGLSGIAFSFKDYVGPLNASEAAHIVDLFPVGMMLAGVQVFTHKRKDVLSILLSLFAITSFIYMAIGFPAWLAKLTLFAYTTPNRLLVIFQIVNIVLLARCLSRISISPTKRTMSVILIGASLYGIIVTLINYQHMPEYCGPITALGLFMVIVAVCCSLLPDGPSLLSNAAAAIAVIGLSLSGLYVNPVQYATAPLTDQPLSNQVKAIQRQSPGLWLTEGGSGQLSQFLIANGIPTLNALQVTPAMNIWSVLDPAGRWSTRYNRYAFIEVNIVDTPSPEPFINPQPDQIKSSLTPSQLDSLHVRYILSGQRLDEMRFHGYHFEPVGIMANGRSVYEMIKG